MSEKAEKWWNSEINRLKRWTKFYIGSFYLLEQNYETEKAIELAHQRYRMMISGVGKITIGSALVIGLYGVTRQKLPERALWVFLPLVVSGIFISMIGNSKLMIIESRLEELDGNAFWKDEKELEEDQT